MKAGLSFLFTLSGFAALAGCAAGPPLPVSSASLTVLEANELPAPPLTRGGVTLGPLDKIRVEVFGVEELTREVQIDSAGRISFPFVGAIDVSGNSSDEVEALIASSLAQGYVKDPIVSVNLTESSSQTIAIEGAVERPGLYPAAGRLTLLRAMALAGGSNEFAYDEQIVIFRDMDAGRYAAVYNINSIRQGLVDDPRVYSNDVIVIGESPRRRALDRLLQIAPTLTSPLILLLTRT